MLRFPQDWPLDAGCLKRNPDGGEIMYICLENAPLAKGITAVEQAPSMAVVVVVYTHRNLDCLFWGGGGGDCRDQTSK